MKNNPSQPPFVKGGGNTRLFDLKFIPSRESFPPDKGD